MEHFILLKVKIQKIYFQDRKNGLGTTHATSEKRITLEEAKDILIDREIEHVDVLRVKYEFVEIEVPLKDFENHIIQ